MASAAKPDLAVGLILARGAGDRPSDEGAGLLPHVADITATILNVGDAMAEETNTRFWVHGDRVDRELRMIHTPQLLPGDQIDVTALWDLRDGPGRFTITVTADAFAQIDEVRKDNNTGRAEVSVRGDHVSLV